ncbi:hypothetical protein PIB30_008441, partial [Stylosanthes scabra]|nr:hypothetical protein [Stylosanthes scabra]
TSPPSSTSTTSLHHFSPPAATATAVSFLSPPSHILSLGPYSVFSLSPLRQSLPLRCAVGSYCHRRGFFFFLSSSSLQALVEPFSLCPSKTATTAMSLTSHPISAHGVVLQTHRCATTSTSSC